MSDELKSYDVHFRFSVQVEAADDLEAIREAIADVERRYSSLEEYLSEIADPEDLTSA